MAIQAELRLGIRDFNANLDRATNNVRKKAGEMKRETSGIGESFAGIFKGLLPAVGLGVIVNEVKQLLTRADDLADLTVKLNENAEALQRVDFAAQQAASIGVDRVADAMVRLEKNLGQVENSTAADALKGLGLNAADLIAMPLDAKILAFADAFQKAREEGTGMADLMDLVGRSGAELVPLLGMAREEIEALFAKAPVLADAQIMEMAKMNDAIDAQIAKLKSFEMEAIAGWIGVGQFVGDVLSTGSIEEAGIRRADRDMEATQAVLDRQEKQKAAGVALEAARAAEEEAAARKKSADEAEKTAEELERIKQAVADQAIDMLPDDEKLAALRAKLEQMLQDTVGMFSLNFETSTAGLEKLAKSREDSPNLPGTGQNSAQEAYEWLEAARDLEQEIADLQEKAADKEAAAAKKRADELEKAREAAEAVGFALLSPEEQAAKLREQLEGALGLKVGSSADIERGLKEQRDAVEKARESGDAEAEKAALDRLNKSQQVAKEFYDAAGGLAPGAPAGGVGSLAGLVNQMFGRDPQAQQVEELKTQTQIARETKAGIDTVIKKMDEQPPAVVFGGF